MNHNTTSRKVLIVDDDESTRKVLERIISRLGYTVHTADGGAQALELLRTVPDVDLVFLDIEMPHLNGLDTLAKIREAFQPGPATVMVTGKTRAQDIMKGYERGADYYVTKPFTPKIISNITTYLLGDLDETESAALELVI